MTAARDYAILLFAIIAFQPRGIITETDNALENNLALTARSHVLAVYGFIV